MRREALERLQRAHRDRAWFVFEGVTFPDVYLETPNVILVIEGKRTEADITRSTTWMPTRHQMLRHIDATWDHRGEKAVLGMFIVEGEGGGSVGIQVPPHWQKVAAETASPEVLAASLPHRSLEEQRAIGEAYIGITTWQRVCKEFDIPWDSLPVTAGSPQEA